MVMLSQVPGWSDILLRCDCVGCLPLSWRLVQCRCEEKGDGRSEVHSFSA